MKKDGKTQSRFKGSLLLVFQGQSSRFPGGEKSFSRGLVVVFQGASSRFPGGE